MKGSCGTAEMSAHKDSAPVVKVLDRLHAPASLARLVSRYAYLCHTVADGVGIAGVAVLGLELLNLVLKARKARHTGRTD